MGPTPALFGDTTEIPTLFHSLMDQIQLIVPVFYQTNPHHETVMLVGLTVWVISGFSEGTDTVLMVRRPVFSAIPGFTISVGLDGD